MHGRVFATNESFLKDDLLWRVGNVESVKIWGDKWILCPTSYAIQSPVKILGLEARVKELIDEYTRLQNLKLIQEMYV